MLLEAILFEANIANMDQLQVGLKDRIDRAELSPPVGALLLKRLLKAIQKDDEQTFTNRQRIFQIPANHPNPPTWLQNALDRGDEVFHAMPNGVFNNNLHHVIDWLRADPQAERTLKAIPDQNFFTNAVAAANTYFAKDQKASAVQEPVSMDEAGREVVMTFRQKDGKVHFYNEDSLANDPERGPVVAFWARLVSPEALNREGKLMSHCVGSYCKAVEENRTVIYSLRDMKNDPHATIEFKQGKQPEIHQVKGKGNTAPTGKYAPYIRDFLNNLGVYASQSGAGDLRGLGLVTQNGKYGTIAEIGGNMDAKFENGDSIRSVETHPNTFYYVEKNGSVPFQFLVDIPTRRLPARDYDNEGNPISDNKATVYITKVEKLREDKNKAPIYSKNMAQYLNGKTNIVANQAAMFSFIGLYYDAPKKTWGTEADLTEKLFDLNGIVVLRLNTRVVFNSGKTELLIGEMNPRSWALIKLHAANNAVNNAAMTKARDAVVEYMKRNPPYSDAENDLARSVGVFPTPSGVKTDVPENKKIFEGKNGSIRFYSHRLFFYDPQGVYQGAMYVGTPQSVFVQGKGNVSALKVDSHKITAYASSSYKVIYALISDLSQDKNSPYHINLESFRYVNENDPYKTIKNNYVEQNQTLLPRSQVEFKVKIRGYTVEMEPHSHSLYLTITEPGASKALFGVTIDNHIVERLDSKESDHHHTQWSRDQAGNASAVQNRAVLAAALNHANVKMKRVEMLDRGLVIKNGKFAPQTDKDILSFTTKRKIDLGKGFFFERDSYYYSDADRLEFGTIRNEGNSEYSHPTVVYISWTYRDRQELSYRMVKDREGIERKAIISAAARFMKIYHDKLEPFFHGANQYVGPAAKDNEFDESDED